VSWRIWWLNVALATVTMLGQPNVVPFELFAEYLIVVHGSIGAARDLAFVVDTGTTRTVVDASLAARLGSSHGTDTLRSFGREVATDTAVLSSLTLGPIGRSNLPVLVGDLQSQRQQLGLAPDALVGLDVLGSGCLTIDYRERRLTFGCGGHWEGRMPFVPGVPAVEAVVDGTAYRLKDSSSWDGADDVIATYTADVSGETANGTWKLRVRDVYRQDSGYIDSWKLTF